MENQPHCINSPFLKGCPKDGVLSGVLSFIFLFTLHTSLNAVELSRMRYAMGTLLQIRVQAKDKETAEKAIEAGFQEVERIEQLLSNWKKDSEISRINSEAYPNGIKTTQEMAEFLLAATQLSELTDGYFDITIEPLTQLWKLREGKLERMPTEEEIEKARAKVNYKNLEISTTALTVRFLVEGMGIDTGGIGKGYALDKALEKIRGFDAESATLNFGGQILSWSKTPKKNKVAIKNPLKPEKVWKKILLAECSQFSASTSGNYENAGHILNPKSGLPVETPSRSVTVLSLSATLADTLSTAFFVMQLPKTMELSDKFPLTGVMVLSEPLANRLTETRSENWEKWLQPDYVDQMSKKLQLNNVSPLQFLAAMNHLMFNIGVDIGIIKGK